MRDEWPSRAVLRRANLIADLAISGAATTQTGSSRSGGGKAEPIPRPSAEERWCVARNSVLRMVRAREMWKRRLFRVARLALDGWWALVPGQVTDEEVKQMVKHAGITKSLDFAEKKLQFVPHHLLHMSVKIADEVKKLELSKNYLRYVEPELLAALPELNQLRLLGNNLRVVPRTIACLTQLRMLFLNDNNLQVLPPEMGDLVHMHTLHVQNNPHLKSLPIQMGKLKHQIFGGCLKEVRHIQLVRLASCRFPLSCHPRSDNFVNCETSVRSRSCSTSTLSRTLLRRHWMRDFHLHLTLCPASGHSQVASRVDT
jgi:Leucine-rich repeat (LRR) protein